MPIAWSKEATTAALFVEESRLFTLSFRYRRIGGIRPIWVRDYFVALMEPRALAPLRTAFFISRTRMRADTVQPVH